MIGVDSRENSKHPSIAEALRSDGREVEVKLLDTGDFTIFGAEDNYVCEHKTPSDFISSLRSSEGWNQVKALAEARDQGFKPLYVWEASPIWDNALRRKVNWDTYLKRYPHEERNWLSLHFGLAKWGIPLIPTKDEGGTIALLEYIDETLGKAKERNKDYPMRSGFRRDMSLTDKRIYLFDAFGHATGKALLTAYGSPIGLADRKWLTHWVDGKWTDQERLVREVADVKLEGGRRIGEKKAQEIVEVLLLG